MYNNFLQITWVKNGIDAVNVTLPERFERTSLVDFVVHLLIPTNMGK